MTEANGREEFRRLPPGFVWGVSTASYQIEGAAREDGRGPSVWDTWSHEPGRIKNGDTGDVACDHYHRWAEDIGLMKQMGVGAYRFSVAWPRVLPQGTIGAGRAANEAGLAFYDRLVDGLLAAGIEPWLCLYHWDLPQALQDRGGWTNRDSAAWFADYARLVASRLGDRVKRYATFNEPAVFTLFGYSFGWHPPGTRDLRSLYAAMHHVNLAHGAAVDVLRANVAGARIGAVHNRQPCRAVGKDGAAAGAADRAAASLLDDIWNMAFPDPQVLGEYPASLQPGMAPFCRDGDLERIRRPVDWFGVNHYGPIYAREDREAPLGFAWADAPADAPRSPIGWSFDPDGFRDTLIEAWQRYRLPIYVTENGAGAVEKPAADGTIDDAERIAYLQRYTDGLREAVARGADVRGYFVWSILDNFEWGAGYDNRFGLVYVDYATLRRTPKSSARWYADLIRRERAAAAREASS